jgi:hypothetical protein
MKQKQHHVVIREKTTDKIIKEYSEMVALDDCVARTKASITFALENPGKLNWYVALVRGN